MKKRIVSYIMVLAIMLGFMSGCRPEGVGSSESQNTLGSSGSSQETELVQQSNLSPVTRGEWITMLAQTFGFDSWQSQDPYYEDIGQDSNLFAYVQSSCEWGALMREEALFRPDDPVTRGEAAVMSVRAAGWDKLAEGQTNDFDTVLKFAQENGIVSASDNQNDELTEPECRAILLLAQGLYLSVETDQRQEIVWSEGVIDYTSASAEDVSVQGTSVILKNADNSVQEGSVILTPPTDENPGGLACKVVSITQGENGSMILETEKPELSEVLEELDVAFTVTPSPDDFVPGEGFSVSEVSADEKAGTSTLVFQADSTPVVTEVWNYSKKVEAEPLHFSAGSKSGSFSKKSSNKNTAALGGGAEAAAFEKSSFVYDATPSIEDFKGSTEGWTKQLEIENSFSGGYEITGSVDVSNMYIAVDVNYEWFELKSFDVEVNADVTSTLQVTGELHERLKIGKARIPTPVAGLTVDLVLELYTDANGELQLEWVLSNNTKVEYSGGNLRKTTNADSQTSFQLAVELGIGANASVGIAVFGLGIVDVNASVGADLTAQAGLEGTVEAAASSDGTAALTYREAMTLKADLYYPIVSLGVGNGDNLANQLGLSGTWDLITKDNAKHQTLLDYNWVFWEETIEVNADDVSSVPSSESEEEQEQETKENNTSFILKEQYLPLEQGESYSLTILSLPDGVTEDQLIFESKNSEVASVAADGTITGNSQGSTQIYVKTPQGGLQVCAVTVWGEAENDWVFL